MPLPPKKRVLIISHDKVGSKMAGPGIRYHHIASVLSKYHDVTLAVFNPVYIADLHETSYKTVDIHVQNFQETFSKYDVIIALWLSDDMIRYAKSKNITLIFDLYAPVPVEDLVQRVFGGKISKESNYDYTQMLRNYRHFIRNGDYLLVSNDQQRDFWMGYAFASEKVTPSLQSIRPIDTFFGVCPMGIDLEEVRNLKLKDLLSKRIDSIKKDDFIIVWTGGIWDWFDARTPIESIKNIVDEGHKDIKLVFLGTKHPNDDVPAMAETHIARDLAKKLGLFDKYVFFLDGWLPYEERVHYLSRANAALYAHKPSVESRFSHRTRVLDHILMKIPTIATDGDYFSDYIMNKNLGFSVEPFSSSSMAKTILSLKTDQELQRSISHSIELQQRYFTWDVTLAPLLSFLESDYCISQPYTDRSINNIDTITEAKSFNKIKRLVPTKVKRIVKQIILKNE